MLVNFRVSNLRSFYDEVEFSMQAENSVDEFSELNTFSVDEKLTGKNQNELLKSALIFGANASGKSNLIQALTVMAHLVVNSSRIGASILNIVEPFAFFEDALTLSTKFEIDIIAKDIFYNYSFELKEKKIISEVLFKRENGRLVKVFERKNNQCTFCNKPKQSIDNIDNRILIVSYAFSPFLSIAQSIKDLQNVLQWFTSNNLLVFDQGVINFYNVYQEDNCKYEKQALEFLRRADIGINNFVVETKRYDSRNMQFNRPVPPQLINSNGEALELDIKTEFNIYNNKIDKKVVTQKIIYVDRNWGFHSEGTYRLVQMLGVILKVLDKGGILIIDEIDSKMHFYIIEKILEWFNSIDKNKSNAQLIATIHNQKLMDSNFRRDQIWFTQKDEFGQTELYSLVDFKGVRKDDIFSKHYLAGFYSAIPNLQKAGIV